jgi:hypothetical protein
VIDSDSTYFTGRTAARTRTRTITSTLIYPAPGPADGAETGMIDAMHYIDAETTMKTFLGSTAGVIEMYE